MAVFALGCTCEAALPIISYNWGAAEGSRTAEFPQLSIVLLRDFGGLTIPTGNYDHQGHKGTRTTLVDAFSSRL
jgi:hypothetical protein